MLLLSENDTLLKLTRDLLDAAECPSHLGFAHPVEFRAYSIRPERAGRSPALNSTGWTRLSFPFRSAPRTKIHPVTGDAAECPSHLGFAHPVEFRAYSIRPERAGRSPALNSTGWTRLSFPFRSAPRTKIHPVTGDAAECPSHLGFAHPVRSSPYPIRPERDGHSADLH